MPPGYDVLRFVMDIFFIPGLQLQKPQAPL